MTNDERVRNAGFALAKLMLRMGAEQGMTIEAIENLAFYSDEPELNVLRELRAWSVNNAVLSFCKNRKT